RQSRATWDGSGAGPPGKPSAVPSCWGAERLRSRVALARGPGAVEEHVMSHKILPAAVLGLVALAIAATAGRPPLPTVGAAAMPLAGPPAQAERVLRVPVGDLDVAYRVLGQGEPLVLITGFRATIDDWDPTLLAELAAHYLVIAFDNRGMGGTSAPPGE